MDQRGPKGTTAWTRYEVSISAPADAHAVYFGATHSGTGAAWFDSLQIEIDGVPYSSPNAFDLDFESSTPLGFHLGGEGYRGEIDAANAHTGKQSLRIERTEASSNTSVSASEESRAPQLCRGVLDDMSARRAEYSKAGASAHEIEWAIQNARLLVQYEQMKVEGGARDRAMAENIEWIANQNPGAKIVVWAHNGHVSYQDYSMGGYLKQYFGPQIVNFGFIFDQGSFRASDAEKHQLVNFTVGPAPSGTWASALATTRIPLFALNLRLAVFDPRTVAWMIVPHLCHSVGAIYDQSNANKYWHNTQLQNEFDAIFFVEKTTASHGLP